MRVGKRRRNSCIRRGFGDFNTCDGRIIKIGLQNLSGTGRHSSVERNVNRQRFGFRSFAATHTAHGMSGDFGDHTPIDREVTFPNDAAHALFYKRSNSRSPEIGIGIVGAERAFILLPLSGRHGRKTINISRLAEIPFPGFQLFSDTGVGAAPIVELGLR